MIHSALKILASHDPYYSIVRLMGCATNKHLARLDLRENPHKLSGAVLPYLVCVKASNV
jgi:hypothetical protein